MTLRLLLGLVLSTALVAACGDDGGDDGGNGGSDAAVVSDAAAVVDGAPESDGGSDSPYELVTCEGSPDDAGPSDAGADDAGPTDGGTPGLGAPCCDPDGACSGELECIEGPDGDRSCSEPCDLATGECPGGGVCANFGGDGVCIPAGTEGQDCAPELCDSETICVGDTADDATCHRRCMEQGDCDEGTTCSTLGGTESKACL